MANTDQMLTRIRAGSFALDVRALDAIRFGKEAKSSAEIALRSAKKAEKLTGKDQQRELDFALKQLEIGADRLRSIMARPLKFSRDAEGVEKLSRHQIARCNELLAKQAEGQATAMNAEKGEDVEVRYRS